MTKKNSTLAAFALALTVSIPSGAEARQSFAACYVPEVGAMYLIQRDGLPSACMGNDHVQVSWNDSVPGALSHGALEGLTADDHPLYLLVDGVRNAENGFAVTGTFGGGGAIPVEGAGARVLWYPVKAVFRGGAVDAEQWDAANIGDYSVALGLDVQASATYTVALGREAIAETFGSVAIGNLVTASGNNTLATNVGTRAEGNASTAMGHTTVASGFGSLSAGEQTSAEGRNAVSVGRETIAQPTNSLALGRWNSGTGSTTAWIDTDPLLMAGNGDSDASRSNAMTLYKNGNLTIAGTLTESSDVRLKEGVEALGPVLAALNAIEPVRYRFREGTGHPSDDQIGLIAQEVEAAFPELVTRDAEGYLSVAYPKLSAVLLGGLQEQQVEIERQREEIAALSDRIDRLTRALDALVELRPSS